MAEQSGARVGLEWHNPLGCDFRMIVSFRHKGLERLYVKGDRRKVAPEHAEKLRRILFRLNEAVTIEDMNLAGYRLHALSGRQSGRWAVNVSGNWRVTFRFDGGAAAEVDYVDYH